MIISIDLSDDLPLYSQIARGVRRAVATGQLTTGDALPSGRDLAQSLGVNLETVQRAYRSLADEGLVSSRVGRGTRVAEGIDAATVSLGEALESLMERADRLGLEGDEILAMVRARLDG